MLSLLKQFVLHEAFPCIMAKSLAKTGHMSVHQLEDFDPKHVTEILEKFYSFITNYRSNPSKLSSFIITTKLKEGESFQDFEKRFWNFLEALHQKDKENYPHDPRVSSNPNDPKFSYSIMSEAFFILALHPQSPRLARRFSQPSIVFNPHQQFEEMRKKGIFHKVRNLIRKRDFELEGRENPMLQDFGERSEVFQYLGKAYQQTDPLPLQI